jgi:2-polyprenyl-3-methyl-5-hydroxy-6-metoxy-1,4-benzoquinol methylase
MTEHELKPCTLCGTACHSSFLFKKNNDNRGTDSINFYQCLNCNIVYLGKYKDNYNEDLYDYYKKYYGKSKNQVFDSLTKASYFRVLKLLESNGCIQTILDVGCGNGSFVDAALEQGFKVQGIELSKLAVEVALDFNLPVRLLDFFSNEIDYCSFDAITFFEVLEHLPNPIQFLLRAEEVVKPGGLIYLTTPNFNSLDRRVLGKNWNVFHREHLTYFTEKNLIKLIQENTKLEILHIETRNLSTELIQYFTNFKLFNHSKNSKNSTDSTDFSSSELKKSYIRDRILKSRLLTLLKYGTNSFLNTTSLGSTLVVLLKKPSVEVL